MTFMDMADYLPNLCPNGDSKIQRRYYYPTKESAEAGRLNLNRLIGKRVTLKDGKSWQFRGLFPHPDEGKITGQLMGYVIMVEMYELAGQCTLEELDEQASVVNKIVPRIE